MRLSEGFIPTLKEIPREAELPSHRLMLRAGLIRMLAAGIYSYLPLGWRVAKRVITIIREEMDRIGGQETFLPAINPLEVWQETGRAADFGDMMFQFKDRRGRGMCLAPTHEEVICDLARIHIRSYRDLPQIWYQIQTKFRDEPRPRSGVLRARQFIMKDSYSLDAVEEGLDRSYQLHREAYQRIFTRCGLDFIIVGASSGLMGGSGSQEFMLISDSGEDTVVTCPSCHYAANLEVATSVKEQMAEDAFSGDTQLREVHTPGKRTVEEVSGFLHIPKSKLIKSLLFIAEQGPVMALISGDDDLNEAKLMTAVGAFRPAHQEEVRQICKAEAGFIGPIELEGVTILGDLTLTRTKGMATGANRDDYHIVGIDVARDVQVEKFVDLRIVGDGEGCPQCARPLKVINAIEIGHIFRLGTKYSQSMGATFLDEKGRENPIIMGSYGIGIGRIIAAAIEQNHDKNGIIWPLNIAPYQIHILSLNADHHKCQTVSEDLYQILTREGWECLFDDRRLRAGVKFKDADLLGMPIQIVVGEKNLAEDKVEIILRKDGSRKIIAIDGVGKEVKKILTQKK